MSHLGDILDKANDICRIYGLVEGSPKTQTTLVADTSIDHSVAGIQQEERVTGASSDLLTLDRTA